MSLIYESTHFSVEAEKKPLVDRMDGGHIAIHPKVKVSTRQDLSPKQAIELMRLTMVVGEGMTTVLTRHGVDIGRINYQDNGNWSVFKPGGAQLHVHIYRRAKNAIHQKYGQSLNFPHINENPAFYASLRPLAKEDVEGIRTEIIQLLSQEKYKDQSWGL